jgi:hypothetical protein
VTVWNARDLPVLRALADSEDQHIREGFLYLGGNTDQLGLNLASLDVMDSVLTLRDAGYVAFRDSQETGGANLHLTGLAVTGRGLQALGEWPSFEAVATPDLLAALLEHLAPEAPTADETAATRAAADYVRSVAPGALRSIVTGAVSALLRAHGIHA